MKNAIPTKITSLLLAVTFVLGFAGMWVKPAQAAGPNCSAKASGNWSDWNTWSNCFNGIPGIETNVYIGSGYTVTVDQSGLAAGSIYVESGGELNVSYDLAIFGTQNGASANNYIKGYVTGAHDLVTNLNSGAISFTSNPPGTPFPPDYSNTPALTINNSGVTVAGTYKSIWINSGYLNIGGDLKIYNKFVMGNAGITVNFNDHSLIIGYASNGRTDMRWSGANVYGINTLTLEPSTAMLSNTGNYLPNELTSVVNIVNSGNLDLGGRSNTFTVSGNVTNSGVIYPSDKWTQVGGYVNNTGTGWFDMSQYSRTQPFTVAGNFTSSGRVTTSNDAQDLIIGGDLTINDPALYFITLGTGKIKIGGNFVNNGNYNGGRGLIFNGAGDQTLSSVNTLGTNSLKVDKPSGKLTLNTTPTVYGDVTINQGTLSIPSGYSFNGSYPSNTFSVNSGGTLQLGGSYFPSSTYGTVTFNSGSTVEYNGAADQTITSTSPYSNLALSGGSTKSYSTAPTVNGALSLVDGTTLRIDGTSSLPAAASFTLGPNSTVNYAGSDQTVATAPTYGNLTLSGSGTKTAGTGALNVAGNWNNSVTFSPGSGTVNLTGGSQTLTGATTFNNLSKIVSSPASLTFPAGLKQTVLGTLTLKGEDTSKRLALRSSASPTQWQIDPQSTRSMAFLDVKDSNNTNSTVIIAAQTGSLDSGNNTNWAINPPTVDSVTLPANSTYIGGQTMTFTVNWNSALPVTVTNTPQLALIIGSNTRQADYQPGSSTGTASVFSYTVVDADQAPGGISIGVLTLNGGTIQSAQGVDASLTLNGVGATSGIKVRGTYTLTLTTFGSGSGTVASNPNQTQIRGGTSVALTANPEAGSSFINWSGDASGTTNPLTFNMDGDKTITAAIELNGNMYVDPSYNASTPGWGVTRFASIQAALTAAPTDADTQLHVAASTYTGDVTLNNSRVTLNPASGVIIDGSLTQSAGTLEAPAGTLTINGNYSLSGGTFNGNGGTLSIGGNFTRSNPGVFNAEGGLVKFTGTGPAITGSVSFANLEMAGTGTLTSTQPLSVSETLTITSGTVSVPAGSQLTDVTIASGGTLNAPVGSFNVSGDFTNNGIFAANGGTVVFNGAGDQNIGGSTTTAFSTLTVNNSGGTLSGTHAITAGTLNINDGIFDAYPGSSFTSVVITSNGEWKQTGSGTVSAGSVANGGKISSTDGTLNVSGAFINAAGGTFNPSGGTLNLGGDLTNNGIFSPSGTSLINLNGNDAQSISGSSTPIAFNNLTISNTGSPATVSSSVPIDILGDFVLNSGIFTAPAGVMNVAGNFTNNATFNANSGTVLFNGSGAQSIGGTQTTAFNNLTIDSGGTVSGTHAITAVNLNITDGTFQPAAGSQFNDILIAADGTLDGSAGNLLVEGDWENNGAFTAGPGSVTFNGSAAQVISGSQATIFNNLIINNSASSPAGVTTETGFTADTLDVVDGLFDPGDGSTIGSVTIQSDGTLTTSNGETVNITGDLTNNGTLSPEDGILNIGGDLTNNGIFSASGGTLNLTGDLINNIGGSFIPSGGQFNLGGDLTSNGTFAATGGDFSFNGAGLQNIAGTTDPLTFYNLSIDGLGPVVAATPIVVNELLEVNQGTFYPFTGSVFNEIVIQPGAEIVDPGGITYNGPILNKLIPDQDGSQDQPFSFQFESDTFTSADPITYTATKENNTALPAWLTFTPATRTFSGLPGVANTGPLEVKVVANNGKGNALDTFFITIQAVNTKSPVLVFPIDDQNAKEGVVFDMTFPADMFNDPASGTLTYRAEGLPQWMTFNPATRTFNGTPIPGAAGINGGLLTLTLTATNASGGTASDQFEVKVAASTANTTPSLRKRLVDQDGVAGTLLTYTLPTGLAEDLENDPLIYTAQKADNTPLPNWLTFNANSHTFSGMPTGNDVGTFLVKVTVSDVNPGVSDIFRITVSSADRSVTYLSLTSLKSIYVDGFGEYVVDFGTVPADAHYYLMVKLNVNVPNALPGLVTTGSGREITLFNSSGIPVTTYLEPPITICFKLTPEQKTKFAGYTWYILTTPNTALPWTKMAANYYPLSNVVCADINHFSLFDLVAEPPVSEPPVEDDIVKTGFAPDVKTILPEQPSSKQYTTMGDIWMEIPALGVKENVVGVPKVDGKFDVSWLGEQIGWLHGSAYPSWNGNSILTGHVSGANGQPGVLSRLNTMKYGDLIIFPINGEKVIYRVMTMEEKVPANEVVKAYQHEETPWVTLITCQGYDTDTDSYLWRVIVRATK